MDKDPTPRPIYKSLYAQVITAIIIGVILGHFWPQVGESMKPLGDGFIKLIKMIIAPIIFCTVVVGIAGMEDMKKVGKTGGLALLYFEIVSSIALIVGLLIINIVQPGAGMNVDPATLDTKQVSAYTGPGKMQGTVDFLLAGGVGARQPLKRVGLVGGVVIDMQVGMAIEPLNEVVHHTLECLFLGLGVVRPERMVPHRTQL